MEDDRWAVRVWQSEIWIRALLKHFYPLDIIQARFELWASDDPSAPETVRWAALRGADIVFHPQFAGKVSNPSFYQHAMVCGSMENNIYFSSVNYALPH